MIIEIIISELDFYLIERVRELRLKSNLSQVMLAHKLGVSEGYIGNIENPKQTAKYNIRMLSRIAIALELDSYLDLSPKKPFSNDLVKIKINLFDKGEVKKDLHQQGEKIERFKEISITPLSEQEILEYDKSRVKK
ncbi:Helix-turn-helix domain-containing protein [Flavobacterium succinicans]|uniref:Helix-turn-helix domain-containing protein n=1 Tax=Flavobacterium succinicans TaxID=29536 RepID=A0A1I4Y309_9FLAO|nr:helix-turn-helix transcriptional regulator [Flavobacterium succinicans]SFN31900.1 Helix-turn-helix domain-containing protein [Flavobacterium succinicans]